MLEGRLGVAVDVGEEAVDGVAHLVCEDMFLQGDSRLGSHFTPPFLWRRFIYMVKPYSVVNSERLRILLVHNTHW